MGDFIPPDQSLAVEVLDRVEATSGEKGVSDVLNGAFDPPLLVAASGPARERGEVIVSAQFKQAGMKANGVAVTLGHNTGHIVVLDEPRNPTPVLECVKMAQEQALQPLIKEELDPQGAGIREGDDKAGEFTPGSADLNLTEVGESRPALLQPVEFGAGERLPSSSAAESVGPCEVERPSRCSRASESFQRCACHAGVDID